jgi:hypothetical protein
MNDPDSDRPEAIRQIATLLAAAYLRLRFPATSQLDSSETESVHVTAG